MKTKLVYVLISGRNDYFSEMVAMSLYSFRRYHPTDVAEIVMDHDTFEWLHHVYPFVLQQATANVVDIPAEYDLMQRSRYLKTNLRRLVKGDFLFIDGDTIICDSLGELDQLPVDIAMVADCNKPLPLADAGIIALNKQAGFVESEGLPYYNSGVILVRDTPAVYDLYTCWYELWMQSVANGVSKDQPALCQANKKAGYPIQELDGIWNWQMWHRYLHYLPKAKVMHYYTAYEWKKYLWKRVKDHGRIDGFTALMLRHPRLSALALYMKRKI